MQRKLFGIVEGFYGKPWTMEDRKEIISFLGKKNLNSYIYAPKDDLLHRFEWRKKYNKDFLDEFKKLVTIGRLNGVEVSYALSPGQSIEYSSESDIEILINKISEFYDLGVRYFSLFLDDIPEKLFSERDKKNFENLYQAHSYFINSVYDKLKKIDKSNSLIICPTLYRGNPSNIQAEIFKDKLHDDIYVFWTGPQVCSEKISAEDANNFNKAFGKKPLYWDNFPVNDAAMVSQLHIGEYKGRDSDLVNNSNGILLNPMNQANSSKIAICQLSEYVKDSKNYNSKIAHEKAVRELAPECSESFLLFSEFCTESPLDKGIPEIYKKIINPVSEDLKNWNTEKALSILNDKTEMIDWMLDNLRKKLNTKILLEIENWLNELSLWNDCLKYTSDRINSYTNSYSDGIMLENQKNKITTKKIAKK